MKILIILLVSLAVIASALTTTTTTKTISTTVPAVSENDIYNKNKYTVVAPIMIRIKQPFRVFVQGVDVAFEFEIKILLASNDNSYHAEKAVKLSKSVMEKTVEFNISTFPASASYFYLKVSSALYNETKFVGIDKNENTLFVQINKAHFKPNDLLLFRVYSVDCETNIMSPITPIDVKIEAEGNEIVKFTNVSFINGKYEGQYQLPNKSYLGWWTVSVINENHWPVGKYFTVDDSIPPPFRASLSVAKEISFAVTKFPITINAEYEFRHQVNGIATINITSGDKYWVKNITCTSKSTTFFVDQVTDLGYTADYHRPTIELTYIDLKTNMQVTDYKNIEIVPYLYKVEFINNLYYRVGSTFPFTVVVKTLDNKPVPNEQILVIISDDARSQVLDQMILKTGNDGTVKSSYKTSNIINYTSFWCLELEGSCSKCQTGRSNSFPLGIKPSVSEGIKLEVISSAIFNESSTDYNLSNKEKLNILATFAEKVDQFYIYIIAKGVLLESRKIVVNGNTSEFSFTPDARHVVMTDIYAFYYKKSEAKIFETELHIQFKHELPNYVKLSLQGADASGNVAVKPGSNISLTVESKPSSIVSLFAVDQRALNSDYFKYIAEEVLYSTHVHGPLQGDCLECFSYNSSENYYLSRMNFYTNVNRTLMNQDKLQNDQGMLQMDKTATPAPTTKTPINYSETWLWEDVTIVSSSAVISRKVPDELTTYFIYGIAMSKTNGLGITTTLPSASVFPPFFISLETPPTMRRGEWLTLEIKVFNYLGSNQTATLTVNKDAMFDATDFATEGWTSTSTAYTKQIKVANNDFKTTFITIKPKIFGVLNIKVSVTCPTAGDSIQKSIRVIFEGIPRSITTSTLVFINSTTTQVDKLLKCNLPELAFKESIEVSATVIGDILAKVLFNLDRLIEFPTGCPEQSMIAFTPHYAVLIYLEAIGKLTADLKTKLISYLTIGYTRMMELRNVTDGSFAGSTWLTGYVAMYFQLASPYISMSAKVVEEALNFVISKQNTDGSFNETGQIFNSRLQSGIGMCGYLAIVLTKLAKNYPTAVAPRNLAVQYLEHQLSSITDTYKLAIVAYALQLGNSGHAKAAYDSLFALKIDSGTEIYWNVTSPTPSSPYGKNSYDIEAAAYALKLHMARNGDSSIPLRIVNYLITQSNTFGGFSSSQDTVETLTALAAFGTLYPLPQSSLKLQLTPNAGNQFSVQITEANALTLQTFSLNSTTRQLNVHVGVNSTGIAIVSLICKFNEVPSQTVSSYEIGAFSNQKYYPDLFHLFVNSTVRHSANMAIVEVKFQTGYSYRPLNDVNIPQLDVYKIETYESNTIVVFYINRVPDKFTWIPMLVRKDFYKLDSVQAGSIAVYDFYDTSLQGTDFFLIP